MAVIGTAGHVDHGKTTLVAALTGVDTDRLPEEKRRGISIELGFAPITLEGEGGKRIASVVDVPGHEGFVGTMVAGAQGVDVALLVVSADEGVMAQTREHVAVLASLEVPSMVVALSRVDRADPDVRALARLDVEELLANTRYAGCRIVELSAKTGEGLGELRRALSELAALVDAGVLGGMGNSRASQPARLGIDRVFAPRGRGVVVTGTLVAGQLAVGDALELFPERLPVRVRGLQVHGGSEERVVAGTRVAVALAGVELPQMRRGQTLAAPNSLMLTRAVDAILARPPGGRAFGRRARVTIHVGTDQVQARLIPLALIDDAEAGRRAAAEPARADAPSKMEPGRAWLVRAVATEPFAVAAADRCVVRSDATLSAIGSTVGVLRIVRVAPGRLAQSRSAYAQSLRALPGDDPARARLEIERAGIAGLDHRELAPRLAARMVGRSLDRALAPLAVRSGEGVRWVGSAARQIATHQLIAAIEQYHRDHPDEEGPTRAQLASVLADNAAAGLAEDALDAAIAKGTLERVGDRVRRAGFLPRASITDPAALALEQALAAGGLAPPMLGDLATSLKLQPAKARALMAVLAAAGRVAQVQGDYWAARSALDALKQRVVEKLRAQGSLTTAELKELIGASRKYVVPLAEWLDAQRVTLRVGDVRKLRGN